MKTLSLLLLSWTTSFVRSNVGLSGGCPGYSPDGRHHYVTDKADLPHGCIYTINGRRPFPPTVDRLAEFTCKDSTHHKNCYGYIINPDYAFWDDEKKEYIDPPQCPHPVPACQDLDDVCVPGGARACDTFHNYVCQSKDLTRTVSNPDGTTTQEPVWCQGNVTSVTRYKCPPRHVSSWEQVTTYCTREAYRVNATHYSCSYYHAPVCSGTIDPSIPLPQCTKTANDCSDKDLEPICRRRISPVQQNFCGAKFDYHTNGTWTYRGNFIECVDRSNSQFCETEMDASVTQQYIAEETCPTVSPDSCYYMRTQFKRPQFCHCIRAPNGTEIAFSCHHDGKSEPWCQGLIEPPRFDEHLRPIPKPGQEVNQPPVTSVVPKNDDDKGLDDPGSKTGVALAAIASVAVIALIVIRRKRSSRVQFPYGDEGESHELELQTSTRNYSDSIPPEDDDGNEESPRIV